VQLDGSLVVAEVSIAASILLSSLSPPPPQAERASAEMINRQGRSSSFLFTETSSAAAGAS
jgi:hypothetical protein